MGSRTFCLPCKRPEHVGVRKIILESVMRGCPFGRPQKPSPQKSWDLVWTRRGGRGLPSFGSHRVGHDWSNLACTAVSVRGRGWDLGRFNGENAEDGVRSAPRASGGDPMSLVATEAQSPMESKVQRVLCSSSQSLVSCFHSRPPWGRTPVCRTPGLSPTVPRTPPPAVLWAKHQLSCCRESGNKDPEGWFLSHIKCTLFCLMTALGSH